MCQIFTIGAGGRVMTIFGCHVGPYFANIGDFEVYEVICGYMKVYKGI